MKCCEIALHIQEPETIHLSIGGVIYGTDIPPYEGEYTVTPSEVTQTLPTSGTKLDQDVVVEPIPSNYGRISYSGSVITVW